MKQGWLVPVVAAVAVLFAATAARAADDDDEAAKLAVQNRQYHPRHEVYANVGLLPDNAYNKGLSVGGGYALHLGEVWAWEIVQAEYVFNFDSALKTQLIQNFGGSLNHDQLKQIEALHYFGSSSLLLKPFYGKFSFLNRSVVHLEIFLALGGAVGAYENADNGTALRFGFDAGAGIRVYVGDSLSLRVDVRDYALFKGATPQSEVYVALSAALSFGGAP